MPESNRPCQVEPPARELSELEQYQMRERARIDEDCTVIFPRPVLVYMEIL
jgi:hypothetical protein